MNGPPDGFVGRKVRAVWVGVDGLGVLRLRPFRAPLRMTSVGGRVAHLCVLCDEWGAGCLGFAWRVSG